MITKRIIPCLDIKDGKVVKGINFLNLVDAGDPVVQAIEYEALGADEIVFLDITATNEKRKTIVELVKKLSENIFIPLTVGGGIKDILDIEYILKSGADKVSLNSIAVKNPSIITEASKRFGSQAVVVAIDAKFNGEIYEVYINAGKTNTHKEVVSWAKEVEALGAGEILLTSIDNDGKKQGYDLKLNEIVSSNVKISVIASGGAGSYNDFLEAFKKTNVSSCLAASLFHFKEIEIKKLKEYLHKEGVNVRL